MMSLKEIAEDALLLAANIRTGESLDESPFGRDHRIAELLVDLAERLVEQAGIPFESVWVPTDVADLVDTRAGS